MYKVRRKVDNKIYALKKIKLKLLKDKELENALNEIRILSSIKHPFIIGYREAFIDKDENYLCLVMDYAEKGDMS